MKNQGKPRETKENQGNPRTINKQQRKHILNNMLLFIDEKHVFAILSIKQHYCDLSMKTRLLVFLDEKQKHTSFFIAEQQRSTVNNEWKCLDMHSFDDSKSPEVVEIPAGPVA